MTHFLRIFLLTLGIVAHACLIFAQRTAPVSAQQLMREHAPATVVEAESHTPPSNLLQENAGNKISAVAPILLGTSGNSFSTYMPMNNNIFANDSTGALIFVHRNDPSLFPGTTYNLRYDISTDRGATWSTNIGPLNPVNGNSRYPQVAGYDDFGSTNPLAGKAIFLSDYLNITWEGLEAGVASLVTSGTPVSQEQHLSAANHMSTGAMTEGRHGEYWASRLVFDGNGYLDSLKIYKGVYQPGVQSITWNLYVKKVMPFSRTYDGFVHVISPSVAFSPDGNTGWISLLGDLTAGADSVLQPILLKTTDGGLSWGNPVEVQLNSFPWVYDSLRTLWVDGTGNPASTGRAMSGFHYDLTVDAAGNPHMFFVVGSASDTLLTPGYAIMAGLSKYAVDLTSSNQGATFDLRLVAPILAFRANFGVQNPLNQDNYPQISRTNDGLHIFYSWVDSDTTIIGFGNAFNAHPDILVAGLRVADGYATCIHPITAGDIVWEGRIFSPQMAPEVFISGSGNGTLYKLPMIVTEMLANDPNLQNAYHYFGNDVQLSETDFAYPPGSGVYWLGCGLPINVTGNINGKVFADYNTNGIYDGGDAGIPNQVVSTSSLVYADFSNASGDFDIAALAGQTYGLQTSVYSPLAWTPTAPTVPYSLNLASPGTILSGNNFGFAPVPNAEDLAAYFSSGTMRSGVLNPATIYIENHGTMPSAGALTLTYDSLTTLVASTPAFATNDTVNHIATWNLAAVPLFGVSPIQLQFTVSPSATLGTYLNFSADVTATGNDVVPANNIGNGAAYVVGSFDPNDKTVSPPGVGANHQVNPGTGLGYRIRFQNTGTAAALNIVVRDTIDADMEISTLQPLGSSHAYSLSIQDGNILVWTFSNIQLPDSNTNEPASHGYIDFRIGPKANLALGTVVENSASIYFDFNLPVLTNTAWITYDLPAALGSIVNSPAIRIYPNPMQGNATVEFQRYDGSIWSFELLDLQGRRIHFTGNIGTSVFHFERAGLTAGTYLYKAGSTGNPQKTGLLILE